jgi:hypothetical protein
MQSAIIIGLIQLIIKEAPGAIAGIRALLAKEDPTAEDFAAARAQIEKDTFQSLVPNSVKFPAPPAA